MKTEEQICRDLLSRRLVTIAGDVERLQRRIDDEIARLGSMPATGGRITYVSIVADVHQHVSTMISNVKLETAFITAADADVARALGR